MISSEHLFRKTGKMIKEKGQDSHMLVSQVFCKMSHFCLTRKVINKHRQQGEFTPSKLFLSIVLMLLQGALI